MDEREESPFGSIFASILRGERPSQQSVEDALRSTVEGLFGQKVSREDLADALRQAREAAARGHSSSATGGSASSSGSGARSRPSADPAEQAAAQRARDVSWARRILGFKATIPLTKDEVKKRFRELARKHHPDVGGTDAKMADLNRAMEILLG